MRNSISKENSYKKNHVLNVILLLLPPALISVFVVALFFSGYVLLIKTNPYYSALVPDMKAAISENNVEIKQLPLVEGSEFDTGFPMIPYGTQWATLNVEGWAHREIPVFFGDGRSILSQGAGMWIGSHFCGQNSKVVISAHVMRDFYEMEDVKVGTTVTMNTVYGKYVYRVTENFLFSVNDPSVLYDKGEGDVLLMYTCHSRTDRSTWKTTRRAVKCELVEGYEYEAYLD